MNKPDTLSHYETMARAALYPELVMALKSLTQACTPMQLPAEIKSGTIFGVRMPEKELVDTARALLSRLPERDKGAG